MVVSDSISSRDPVTGERQIALDSEDQEIRRAEEYTQQILSEEKQKGVRVDGETPYFERVTKNFDRLKQVAHRKHLPWEVHVLDIPGFQAFTIGGGKVFVHSGLFQGETGIQNDTELAAVLAHEMAHVAARHANEKMGKLAIAKLADKGLRKEGSFDAAFTTIQEAEADKYSALYLALAGYDPKAGVDVWSRMQKAAGSYTRDMLYDHPLPDDRAKNMATNAAVVRQYLIPGQINPDHEALLEDNALYSYLAPSTIKAGEGGGLASFLELTASTLSEVTKAKSEQLARQQKQLDQERSAVERLKFNNLRIADLVGGGRGLFGVAVNLAGKQVTRATITLKYLNGQNVLAQEEIPWSSMQPFEQREFGFKLKPIQYESVSVRAVYVQLIDE
jgi:hypothetical protein